MTLIGPRHFVLAALLAAPIASASEPPGPLDTVQRTTERILTTLQDPSVPRQERWTRIAPIIEDSFDFLSMSQGILAQRWESAQPEEQRQFVDYFSQYLEATYRSRIEAYSGQRIEYRGERVRGDRASVSTVIHSGNTPIPVGYFLRRAPDGAWKAYDVTIEGVSLVNSYRETYQAIARTTGISGVLSHMRRRLAEARTGGVPDEDARGRSQ